MQTFLPYPDFTQTARVLDMRRLNKQQTETMQIINALTRPDYGWKHHPAVKMWRGYVPALAEYGHVLNKEWVRRGYKHHATVKAFLPLIVYGSADVNGFLRDDCYEIPPWLGDEAFHASHRSNLLRKDLEFYSQWGWSDPIDLPYVWPV